MVRNVVLPSSKRSDSTKALFLITDGEANVGGSPKKAADQLEEAGVEIYVIGVGKKVKDESLKRLASNPENVFPVKKFRDLETIKRKIAILPTKGRN